MNLREALETHALRIKQDLREKRKTIEHLTVECVTLDDQLHEIEAILEYDRKLSVPAEHMPRRRGDAE